ncbi:ComEC/Rec2 family competence protein [Microbacterium lacticum]
MPIAGAAWLAAALITLDADAAAPAALALWVGAVIAVVLAPRLRGPWRTRTALVAVAAAVAAGVCTQVAVAQPGRDAAAALQIDGGRSLTFELTAVGKIERSADGWRFDALLHRALLGGRASEETVLTGAGVPVLVRLPAPLDAQGAGGGASESAGIDLGARLRISGTAWQADPGERAVLVVDGAAGVEVLAAPEGALAVASALRRGLVALTTGLPAPGGGLIAGLAVGDTTAVDDALDAAMKTSSLSHLTAVSGANCALVVALAFGAAALCRARRGLRVLAGLATLAAFVVLVSPEPSVVRAAAMSAIAMLGILLGRPGAGLSLLTTAVIALLIADPWLALSLGFTLSAAATGALLVGAGPLADGLARWMPRPLALGISVPLAAQIACGPLIVLISPRLSVYGVVANIIAAPAAPLGTIIGLAACVGAGVPLLGSGLAALAWIPAAWIAGTASTFAGLPGAVVDWPEGVWGLGALSVLGAAVAALIVPGHPRTRAAATLVLAAALGWALAAGPIAGAIGRTGAPTGWSIAACDVGQGDAVLVRSAGRIALIDTGPAPELLARCLQDLGVDRIDLLVLTHFDVDHRGGVGAVRGRVGVLLHGPTSGPPDERVIDDLAEAGAASTPATRGLTGVLGDARWRVVWPRPTTAPGNDASVVVEFRGGGVPTLLLLGDLSAAGQQAMKADAGLLTAYDVVKVAHHGSADQDAALYARLHPALALVTVGENDYGHPRAETLTLLTAVGARVARTDREGLLAVWRDSDGLRLWRARTAGAREPDAPVGVAPGG